MTELILAIVTDLVDEALERASPILGGGAGPEGKLQAGGGYNPSILGSKRVCDVVERSARQGWESVKEDVLEIGRYVTEAAPARASCR